MAARHGRQRRPSAWRALGKGLAASVAVLLVSTLGVAAYAVADLYDDIQEPPSFTLESEEVLADIPDIGVMDGGLTFFLAGIDKRPADGAFGDPEEDSAVLNDVNLLVHIAQDHSHVEVVSFPRDMLVRVPECADPNGAEGETLSAMSGVKLNTVFHHGGLGCVAKTVEELVGIPIPLAGVVEFYGVAAISEAIGGVDVCLADPIDDPLSGLVLDAGHHSISGMTALAFLRTRHGVGDGSDLGRISSQQAFMASLMRKVQQEGVLEDPIRMYSIAKAALANMQLSSHLQDPATLISIARTVQDLDLSNIVFVQYPTGYTDDMSAVVPSDSAEAVNAALQADAPIALSATATDDASFGTAPEAPAGEPAPEGETPADGEAPADGTGVDGTGSPAGPPTLPNDVTGQSGDEVRCSTANPG
ncbi:LCP family protein [Agromyces mediolanus]|uniref:Transcriptional regulator n=1 Tax=Agromyces mediolanus TaxID=41986 RepID=A0A918CJ53_AGRME|nr:LCP family protein [Agromyces mediolanus]GGR27270.1 transcriptional regulator [Agromyces mediolanus]GLJ71900.1 transcriptional regulator [Agromyces mediolanus]